MHSLSLNLSSIILSCRIRRVLLAQPYPDFAYDACFRHHRSIHFSLFPDHIVSSFAFMNCFMPFCWGGSLYAFCSINTIFCFIYTIVKLCVAKYICLLRDWYSYFDLFFNFKCSMVALQCCVSFYCIARWVSSTYIHMAPAYCTFFPFTLLQCWYSF